MINTPSPSGYEERIQTVFHKRVETSVNRFFKDVHGNACGILNPESAFRVMLAGHCDEIGLMVNYITEQGFIHFRSIGGIDAQLTPGQRVIIHAARGPVLGVIGKRPIHLIEEKERLKVVKIEEQWIDIGGCDRQEVMRLVSVGDPITFAAGFEPLNGTRVVGRGFDDRAGTFVVAEALLSINRAALRCAVYGVSTVQEEIGLRGAKTSAFAIDPHLGIAIDVTFASDCPDVDKRKVGEIALGKGPVLGRGPNINRRLFERMIQVAEKHGIPYQVQAEPRATGTDANAIQVNKGGVVTALVGIPNRYMHTPSEVVDLEDLDNTINLLARILESIDGQEDWTP